MQKVSIGSKNQVVIPREIRRQIRGLKPGRQVSVYALDKNTVALKVSEKSWLENSYGAMKKLWQGKNTISQLEKMRNEWDEK